MLIEDFSMFFSKNHETEVQNKLKKLIGRLVIPMGQFNRNGVLEETKEGLPTQYMVRAYNPKNNTFFNASDVESIDCITIFFKGKS
jgi:hypothetical protein